MLSVISIAPRRPAIMHFVQRFCFVLFLFFVCLFFFVVVVFLYFFILLCQVTCDLVLETIPSCSIIGSFCSCLFQIPIAFLRSVLSLWRQGSDFGLINL